MPLPSTVDFDINPDVLNGSLSDNAAISSLTESITGAVGTQTGTARPKLRKNIAAANGHSAIEFDGISQYLDFGDAFDMGTGDRRIIVVAQKGEGDNMCFLSKDDGTPNPGRYGFMFYTPGGGITLHGGLYQHTSGSNATNSAVAGIANADTVPRIYELFFSRAASTIYFYIDRVLKASRTLGTDDNSTLNNAVNFRLGAYANDLFLPFKGLIFRVIGGVGMSDSDQTAAYAELNSTYLKRVQERLCGHSITEGNGAFGATVSSLDAVPHRLAVNLGLETTNSIKLDNPNDELVIPSGDLVNAFDPDKLVTVVNAARGGQTVDTVMAQFSAQVAAGSENFDQTIITYYGTGVNSPSLNAAQMYQKDKDFAAMVHGAGFLYRCGTIQVAGGAGNYEHNIELQASNALLRADHSHADEFLDIARHRAFTDPDNTDYYRPDKVHLTPLGNQKIADMLAALKAGTLVFPSITKASLAAATIGEAYEQIITATGAIGYEFVSGVLPTGITWDDSNHKFVATAVTGTAGTYSNLIVRAYNADDLFDEKIYSITVSPATAPNTKQVRVFWGAPGSGDAPDGYQVRRTKNSVVGSPFSVGNNLQYLDTNVAEGDDLSYEIRAFKGTVFGAYTAPVSIEFTNGGGTPPPSGLTNYALASNGSTIAANHTYSEAGYSGAASNAIDGDRLFSGSSWGASPGDIYHSNGAGAVLTLEFNATRSISKFNLITVRDSMTEKTAINDGNSETVSTHGIRGYTVEYWNGSAWVNLFSPVTDNNLLLKTHTFTPVSTTKLRISITAAFGSGSARISEIEAWG